MATVPRSPDSFTVAPTSLPGTRLTVPEYQDFGSAQMQRTGQAMTTAGSVAQKAAMEAADEINKIRINDAMNKAVAARMRLTYDDADGFINVKGERAVSWSKDKSLDQDYTERYQKEVDDIANSLGNEQQRKLFRLSVGQEINRFSGTVKQHLATELGNYEKGVRASTIELAQNKGAKEWENPDSVSQSRRVIVNAISSDASLSPEQKADQTIKALSPMHSAVVAAALEQNNTSYAREYLKQFDTELTEDARLRLQKAVDIGDNRVKAQTFGDEMLDSGKTQVEAMAEARKRFTGAERDAAENRIKDIYGVLATAEQRDKKALGDRGWSQIMTTGKLTATTEAELAQKNPEELRQMLDWRDAKRRQAEGQDTAKNGLYSDLLLQMAINPGKFAETYRDADGIERPVFDFGKLEPFLSKHDHKSLITEQAHIIKNNGKATREQNMVNDTVKMIKAQLAEAKIDITPDEKTSKGREAAADYGRFRDSLATALMDEVKANGGKALDSKRMKEIGLSMLKTEIEQDAPWYRWSREKKTYQVTPEERASGKYDTEPPVSFGAIPSNVRNDLIESYIRANPDAKISRSIYGNLDYILSPEQEAAVVKAYKRGKKRGEF